MVTRLGIGASAASAVFFSVILLSNLAIFEASQDRATLYSQADGANLLEDEAAALAGAGGFNLLHRAQSIVESRTLDCSTAASEVAAGVSGLKDVQQADNLTVNSTLQPAADAFATGDMPMLAPFDGSVVGDLDLTLNVQVQGQAPFRVTMETSDAYPVHLPVHIQEMARDCRGALETIAGVVSTSYLSNCTRSSIDGLTKNTISVLAHSTNSNGYEFGYSYAIVKTNPCTVSFLVSLGQIGIQGPGGPFNFRMQEVGSASFAKQ